MPMPVRLLSVITGESEENRTPALRIKSALLLPTKLPIQNGAPTIFSYAYPTRAYTQSVPDSATALVSSGKGNNCALLCVELPTDVIGGQGLNLHLIVSREQKGQRLPTQSMSDLGDPPSSQ